MTPLAVPKNSDDGQIRRRMTTIEKVFNAISARCVPLMKTRGLRLSARGKKISAFAELDNLLRLRHEDPTSRNGQNACSCAHAPMRHYTCPPASPLYRGDTW